jgi:phenylalanyl-tRNA synthetase beta chain
MAIYNRSRVRNDSRSLRTITEASIRLDKELDTETIPLAFSNLITLIQQHCHGKVSSELFDFYPHTPTKTFIKFDDTLPSSYSGINIPAKFSQKIISRVQPLTFRKDLNITEDLVEEVIRFFGYNKIPITTPISPDCLPDITPKILYLIDRLKDDLVSQGYDEVRSWPLVQQPLTNQAIRTQNSINSEYPFLRESIIQSLKNQLDHYQRYKLPNPKFFEIGKIFHKEGDRYVEQYSLGTYDGHEFKETILDNLDKPNNYIPKNTTNTAVELTSQIITLDANVVSPEPGPKLIEYYHSAIPAEILWSIEIADHYQDKYTFRVCYYNCDDKTAKKIHLSAFNLTQTYVSSK